MAALLDNIDLLKNHDYPALCKVCQVDMEDMQDMVAELRALNHNPTEEFEHIEAQPIVPDVIMRPGVEGKWVVELNNDTLPKVLVNQAYYAEISKCVRTKDEKQYVTDKIQSANWLVKSLHQRATTILKVASEIVSQQEAFFRLGVEHLKPLILRDIAEEIEMHESTVSRVTSNKYIHTPRGIFELKYFFTSAIGSTDGGAAMSAESVKHKIKTLIDAEEPAAILSDDKIVEILNEGGVDIARRTVAKYREALKIPSSIQRRREKKRAVGF
jgi:RNA polymerase sigma-54 factor